MLTRRNILLLSGLVACVVLFLTWASLGFPIEISICEPSGGIDKCSAHYVPVGIIRWVLFQLDRYGILITAIATAFIGWFTWSLRNSTRELWLAGERHSERELRAYLHVRDVVMSLLNSKFNPNVQIIIENYGQTPARCVTNTYHCAAMDRPRDSAFSLKNIAPKELADMGPTQKAFSSVSLPVNLWNEMKPRLLAGTQAFYIFGRIDYQDVFGKPRWTEYRFRLLVDAEGIRDDTSLVMDGSLGNRST